MTREGLENQQIWIYGTSLLIGGFTGLTFENFGAGLQWTISPLIAILMYGMFAQIPFLKIREAVSNVRFMIALLIGNFVIVPIIVWGLISIFQQPAPIVLGICLVLLTPCIDYVIVFTQLGKGNEKLMLAATPILFVVQMVLLPLYLWLFMGKKVMSVVQMGPFLEAFFLLIVVPLLLAVLTQLWAKKQTIGDKALNLTAWLPVPFMALVLIVIVASQIGKVYNDFNSIVQVVPIYLLFLIIMPVVSRVIARVFTLEIGSGRALIFSMGTRNSLVVLPLALALPESWRTLVAAVIVTQTIVELIGELIYIKIVPKWILREPK
ncbi:arsenic resistance protein [Fictibacillus sp. 26RED30]|uniref:arsenic resistance protein n=1 Tax=Fictibacillus sp. 26RED30 TaxID=2745877 RepID=UPI0018CEB921|nr:bile acid:sodium symporter [Fictibacillus sp. 26RED30]MBH0160537.1 arsenic resistance protein [Fictibacillus sp. 26RED30]